MPGNQTEKEEKLRVNNEINNGRRRAPVLPFFFSSLSSVAVARAALSPPGDSECKRGKTKEPSVRDVVKKEAARQKPKRQPSAPSFVQVLRENATQRRTAAINHRSFDATRWRGSYQSGRARATRQAAPGLPSIFLVLLARGGKKTGRGFERGGGGGGGGREGEGTTRSALPATQPAP